MIINPTVSSKNTAAVLHPIFDFNFSTAQNKLFEHITVLTIRPPTSVGVFYNPVARNYSGIPSFVKLDYGKHCLRINTLIYQYSYDIEQSILKNGTNVKSK